MENDTVQVEGLPDVSEAHKQKALRKALHEMLTEKHLPLPTNVYIGEAVAYLQFDNSKGILTTVIMEAYLFCNTVHIIEMIDYTYE